MEDVAMHQQIPSVQALNQRGGIGHSELPRGGFSAPGQRQRGQRAAAVR